MAGASPATTKKVKDNARWYHKQDCHGPRLRAAQVTLLLSSKKTPSNLGFDVQGPAGWPLSRAMTSGLSRQFENNRR
ncbi:MAG TPA: hypothetical protein VG889_14615 [Rhizomicrobium sp.]|nr:hypothetical protein [Rhizomicrobium sp.]